MALATLRSICYGTLYFGVICSSTCMHGSEYPDGLLVNIKRTDAQQNETTVLQLYASKKVLDSLKTLRGALEDSTVQCNAPLNILFDWDYQDIIPFATTMLFGLAENDEYKIPKNYRESTVFMELADKLEASSELQKTIAKLSFINRVYETLYAIALHKPTPQNSHSNLKPDAARKWFIACIPNAAETDKTELRKKLYSLQYRSPEFIALREQIINLLKKQKTNEKFDLPAFDTLTEFKDWQTSFLHQAYCAARPANALSSAEFQEIKQLCEFKAYQEYPHFAEKKASCFQCKKHVTLNSFSPVEFACYSCMEKTVNNKIVDLADCYTLNEAVLTIFIKTRRVKDYLLPVWLKHLPQIHMPLLELLIHYKKIRYDHGCYDTYPTISQIKFGITAVDLDPVDIKALSMFQIESRWYLRDSLICTFKIKNKDDVKNFKSELSRLRKLNNFFIKFIAPDGDDWVNTPDNYAINTHYSSIWCDNWFLRATVGAIALYGITKLIGASASYWMQLQQISYNKELSAYNIRLHECASKIPESTQAIAGYLATATTPVNIKLPVDFKAPAFKGNPDHITLPQINAATDAAHSLNQIIVPTCPWGFWSCASAITGLLWFIPTCIIFQFYNGDFPIRCPIITACRIAIVKPKPTNREQRN